MIQVKKISDQEDLKEAFKIREKVFVIEQKVNPEEEYDQYEDSSTHFLAFYNQEPVGTARWRFTPKGIKLERFAVVKGFRRKGVAHALVDEVLKDIESLPDANGKKIYMHSQLTAMPLYAKFEFRKEGEMFEECGIQHFLMSKTL